MGDTEGPLWLVWLLACPKRGQGVEEQVQTLLARADEVYARRGEVGLEAAGAPLREAFGLDAQHPGVGWRLGRQQIAEGLAATEPVAARAAFAEARSSTMRCLEADPTFVSRRTGQGWTEALATVSAQRKPCAAWLALAWVRWSIELGPAAASLDLEAIDALLQATSEYKERDLRSVLRWAEGLTFASRPEWAGQDVERAAAAFDEAIELEPDALVRRVDRYRYLVPEAAVIAENEREEELAQIMAAPARTPEDQRAVSLLAESQDQ
jgi:hypothetical protein